MKAATDEYREESDPLRDFIDERCTIQSGKTVAAGGLWVTYCDWVKDNREPRSLDRRAFTRRLEALGLQKIRLGHNRTWTWTGIGMKADYKLGLIPSRAGVRTDADDQIQ